MATAEQGGDQKKLIDIVTIDDLPSDMKLIAELCGFETARLLLEKCAGIQIYIPKPEKMPDIVEIPTKLTTGLHFKMTTILHSKVTTVLHSKVTSILHVKVTTSRPA